MLLDRRTEEVPHQLPVHLGVVQVPGEPADTGVLLDRVVLLGRVPTTPDELGAQPVDPLLSFREQQLELLVRTLGDAFAIHALLVVPL